MSDKIYVGKGKIVGKYNQLKIGLRVSELAKHANAKGYVNIIIGEMKAPDDYGATHTAWIDDFVPTPRENKPDNSDMPF